MLTKQCGNKAQSEGVAIRISVLVFLLFFSPLGMQNGKGDPDPRKAGADGRSGGATKAAKAVQALQQTSTSGEDLSGDEKEDPPGRRPHFVKRCPEAQVLQKISVEESGTGTGLSPCSSLHKVPRREVAGNRSFFGAASLPSIQEKPFYNKDTFVESDFPSAETPSSSTVDEEPPLVYAKVHSFTLIRYDHRPLASLGPSRSHTPEVIRPDVFATASELERPASRRGSPMIPIEKPSILPLLPSKPAHTSELLQGTFRSETYGVLRVIHDDVAAPIHAALLQSAHILAPVEVVNPAPDPRPGFLLSAASKLGALVAVSIATATLQRTADSIRGMFLARGQKVDQAVAPVVSTPLPGTEVPSDSTIIPLHGSLSRLASERGSHSSRGGSPHANNITPIVVYPTPSLPTITTDSSTIRFGRERSIDSYTSTLSSTSSSSPRFELDPEWGSDSSAPLRIDGNRLQGPRSEVVSVTRQGHFDRLPSTGSCCCRICQNSSSPERLISPCHCKGSMAYVHLSCLERWLNQSGRTYCELCQYQYNATQTPRYGFWHSIRLWYRHPRNRRQLMADLLIGGILTLVTLGLLTVTSVGMKHFVEEGSKLGLSAFTTQGTIVSFLVIVSLAYLLTAYLLTRDQVAPGANDSLPRGVPHQDASLRI